MLFEDALRLVSGHPSADRAPVLCQPTAPVALPPNLTVNELLDLNMQDIRATTREGGWRAHHYHTEMFRRLWGDRVAIEITKREVESWALERKKTHKQNTVKHELALLRRAYNLAFREEMIATNPFARIKVRIKQQNRHQVLSPADEEIFARVYSVHIPDGERLWTLEKFALLTGCRIGEQAWMKPEHIQEDILRIPDEGKTGMRLVPLGQMAQAIAREWVAYSRRLGSRWLFWPDKGDERAKVAESHSKNLFAKARLLSSALNPALIDLHRHDFRRTYACGLIEAGVPIFEVQALLGHATPQQTMAYCKVGLNQLRAAVRHLDRKISVTNPPLPSWRLSGMGRQGVG